KKRKLNCEARVLTSVEGRRLAEEKEHERQAKAQKKSAAKQKEKEKENGRLERRSARDPGEPFTGALAISRSKDDLREIAWSLKLSEEGTKQQILDRIQEHFTSNPDDRETQLYCRLFTRGRRAPAPAPPQQP
ncbi:hypothetical protein GGX14DRAFT_341657, partial [Mycena pura]